MPGPQHYQIKSSFDKDFRTMAVMRSYCGSQRESKLTTPGVGTYDVQKSTDFTGKKISAIKIGTSKRKEMSNSPKKFPGPG